MGATKIEWAEETWNPITGCTKISPGCKNCYAERMAKRLAGRAGYPQDEPFRPGICHEDQLERPYSWRKPRMVFVCSMGDLFHPDVELRALLQVLTVIDSCDQQNRKHGGHYKGHIFMLLTKRPEIMAERLASIWLWGDKGMANVWLGVTAENQEQADKRIPLLLQIPAARRFVSIEPMLGPVDLADRLGVWTNCPECGRGVRIDEDGLCIGCGADALHYGLDWVILGGESGPGARPMHPDWARSVRDQCQAAGVPFFFKQWGEWSPGRQSPALSDDFLSTKPCRLLDYNGCSVGSFRVGKHAAGRLLDGSTWDQVPA